MIRWKDFLYFSKGDRIAIILLSILICISGGIFIYLNNFTSISQDYIYQSEKLQADFVQFENEMEESNVVYENEIEVEKKPTLKKTAKSSNQKLEDGKTIDINVASAATLTRIPGIGDTFAQRIIEYRNNLGGFTSLEQLQEIKGITTNKFSKILPYIILKRKHQYLKVNHCSYEQLSRHPYLSKDQVQSIISIRELRKITSIEDIATDNNFVQRDIDRISGYLSFE